MRKRTLLLLSVFLLAGQDARAQVTLFLGAETYISPSGSADEVHIYDTSIGLSYGHALGRTSLRHDVTMRHLDMDLGDAYAHDGGDGVLHSNAVSYRVHGVHEISDRWGVRGWIGSSSQSALQHSPGESSLYWEGAAAASHRLTPSTLLSIGAGYTRTLGRPAVHALLGASWSNGGPLSADMLLPMHAEVWYAAGRAVDFGIVWRTTGDVYGTGEIDGLAPDAREIRFGSTAVGPSLRVRLGESTVFDANAGTTMRRVMDVPGSGGSFDPSRATFARVGFRTSLR